jgi:hypothetical protein
VDYFIFEKNKDRIIRRAISAKAAHGSTPSLKSAAEVLREYSMNTSGAGSRASNALYKLATYQVTDGLLEMARFLDQQYDCPGFAQLRKIFRTDRITKEKISSKLKTLNSGVEAEALLSNYYKEMRHGARDAKSKESIHRMITTKSKFIYGVITAPLTYHVVKILNEYEIFTDILEHIIKQTDVTQVHMFLSQDKCEYEVKKFKEAKATWFAPRVGIPNPDINRIGFRLKR